MDFNFDRAFKLIPEFNGTQDKLHRFLHCCNIVYKDLKNDNDISAFMELVQAKLVDEAYNKTVLTNTYKTWQELQKDLKSKFFNVRAFAHVQVELVQAQQRFGETVKDFANRIESLLAELNKSSLGADVCGNVDKNIQLINSKTALRAFEDGLKEPIKLIIKASRYDNLKDAISKAIEEENLNRTKLVKSEINPNRQTKCQICSKIGHSARTCYSRNLNNQQPNPLPYNTPNPLRYNTSNSFHNNYNTSTITSNRQFKPNTNHMNSTSRINAISFACAYCKKQGHHISVCRSRKRINQPLNDQPSNSQNTENPNEPNRESKDAAVRVQDL